MKFKARSALLPRAVQIAFSPVRLFGRPLTAALSLITDRNLLSSIFLSFHRTRSPRGIAPHSGLAIARFRDRSVRAILIDIPLFLSEQPIERDVRARISVFRLSVRQFGSSRRNLIERSPAQVAPLRGKSGA